MRGYYLGRTAVSRSPPPPPRVEPTAEPLHRSTRATAPSTSWTRFWARCGTRAGMRSASPMRWRALAVSTSERRMRDVGGKNRTSSRPLSACPARSKRDPRDPNLTRAARNLTRAGWALHGFTASSAWLLSVSATSAALALPPQNPRRRGPRGRTRAGTLRGRLLRRAGPRARGAPRERIRPRKSLAWAHVASARIAMCAPASGGRVARGLCRPEHRPLELRRLRQRLRRLELH